MTSVLTQPTAYDVFMLDGERSPGFSRIVSGGNAKEKIQDHGQPFTMGANTMVVLHENCTIVYEIRIWEPAQFAAWERWQAMFHEGRMRRPPRVYQLVDLRCPWVERVVYEDMDPQVPDKPGGPWVRKLTMHQYRRVAPYGGPIRGPVSYLGKQNEALGKANAAKGAKLAAAEAAAAAARAGK